MNTPLTQPFSALTFPTKRGVEESGVVMIDGAIVIPIRRPDSVTKDEIYEAICYAVPFEEMLKQIADCVNPLRVEVKPQIVIK